VAAFPVFDSFSSRGSGSASDAPSIRCLCRPERSLSGSVLPVVEAVVPLEFAEQLAHARLLVSRNEFLESPGYGRLLCLLAAYRNVLSRRSGSNERFVAMCDPSHTTLHTRPLAPKGSSAASAGPSGIHAGKSASRICIEPQSFEFLGRRFIEIDREALMDSLYEV